MPELPEVEHIRRTLLPALLGRRVVRIGLHRRDVVVAPGDPFGGFARQRGEARLATPRRVRREDLLQGCTIGAIERRGKQLAVIGNRNEPGCTGERAVVVQLGMSGQLIHIARGGRAEEKSHIHAEWRLDDGSRLMFRDPRRFGCLRVVRDRGALQEIWRDLGPDGLTIEGDGLAAAMRDARRAVKAALLDQGVIAGVGNIYADEALFLAGIAPLRIAASLTSEQSRRLAGAIREVLHAAVEAGGSTVRDYKDANGKPGRYQQAHRVYGRGGEPCVACGCLLVSGEVAQRTTVWCRRCQRA